MIELIDGGVWLFNGREAVEDTPENSGLLVKRLGADRAKKPAREGTITHGILSSHNRGKDGAGLRLKFDALASHDITFVNIIQTAQACGLERFPLPYILTNCHNSLCAVGGTINEDDHLFGLSAAEKYGGVWVPAHLAVIHSYMRETWAGCGRMILGSDSHTRYGALGTMGVGEGGGELVKQLLGETYDIGYPAVVGVYLSGKPGNGVGPQDVALALIGAVFKNGFAKNAVLEFTGEGAAGLSVEFRSGIDVMTTETACWSSIWETGETVRDYLALHRRASDYKALRPADVAYYDRFIRIDLSRIKPMIALPFHPSNVYEIDSLLENPGDILRQVEKDAAGLFENRNINFTLTDKIDEKGRIRAGQGIIAGCAGGTYENIMAAAAVLEKTPESAALPGAFSLSVYPGSQPVLLELARNNAAASLVSRGVILRTAFCGPCFGAGDVPANNCLSIRHSTRNFPNREGSRPADGQIASVALMDARSVAATMASGGFLASAARFPVPEKFPPYHYDDSPYRSRVFDGSGRPRKEASLRYGPSITGWPEMENLGEHLLLKIASFITDPVTTTDEIIPSGETSSYRSNPVGLAEFTLSRKDPSYVGRAKALREAEALRLDLAGKGFPGGKDAFPEFGPLPELSPLISGLSELPAAGPAELADMRIGSAIYAAKPGDGSAREQAASCQRVLGGLANFALEYATKRYRSNLINWGILPFTLDGEPAFRNGDYIFIPRVRTALVKGGETLNALIIRSEPAPSGTGGFVFTSFPLALKTPVLTPGEKEIVLAGSLINYNRSRLR
ncbi:MAG: hydratase [Spirochaetaceae bacterium]|jgi:aconitate hydratase|nr:hydratase [Spirochaetaceae bacterium]